MDDYEEKLEKAVSEVKKELIYQNLTNNRENDTGGWLTTLRVVLGQAEESYVKYGVVAALNSVRVMTALGVKALMSGGTPCASTIPDGLEEPKTAVKLQYFKKSGKYYSEGLFPYNKGDKFFHVAEQVRLAAEKRTLPCLVPDHSDFDVLITGEGHPGGFPIFLHI